VIPRRLLVLGVLLASLAPSAVYAAGVTLAYPVARVQNAADGYWLPDTTVTTNTADIFGRVVPPSIFNSLPVVRESRVVTFPAQSAAEWREYYSMPFPASSGAANYTVAAFGRSRAVSGWPQYDLGLQGITASTWAVGSVSPFIYLHRTDRLNIISPALSGKPVTDGVANFAMAEAGARPGLLPNAAPEVKWYLLGAQVGTLPVSPTQVPNVAGQTSTNLTAKQYAWIVANAVQQGAPYLPVPAGQWWMVKVPAANGTLSYTFGITWGATGASVGNFGTKPDWEVSNWLDANHPGWANEPLGTAGSMSWKWRFTVVTNGQVMHSMSGSSEATNSASGYMPLSTIVQNMQQYIQPMQRNVTYNLENNAASSTVALQRITGGGYDYRADRAGYVLDNFAAVDGAMSTWAVDDPIGDPVDEGGDSWIGVDVPATLDGWKGKITAFMGNLTTSVNDLLWPLTTIAGW
jgi:hypothetical protein